MGVKSAHRHKISIAGIRAMDATVNITIELFGTARLVCGRRLLETRIPANVSVADVAAALVRLCPALVGVAIRDDLSGLLSSYTLNINATDFVEGDELTLREGDTLLIFSSQAGG